ncbi:hypothetical protein MKX08_007575 [Trichoderma sp. CBMAI-0020]|nr:hypothetical protein MKX08_007575 [Trichoderma sp. CBMAI-0020]
MVVGPQVRRRTVGILPDATSSIFFKTCRRANHFTSDAFRLNVVFHDDRVVTNPPDGWTVNEEEMDINYYWSADGPGAQAASNVGLTESSKLQPQMIRSRETGGGAYIFTYDGKPYLWDMLQDDVFLHTEPADLEGVLREMRKQSGKVTRELVVVD